MTTWTRTLTVAIGLIASAGSAAGEPGNAQTSTERPTLDLAVRNVAEVNTVVLEKAKETLTRIYDAAGIQVRWNAKAADFTIIVKPPPHPAEVHNSMFVLGYAPGTESKRGRLAFIFADRVENRSTRLRVPHHVLLGIAMAHEVGHLLLPYNSHSGDGIMRHEWTQSDHWKARLGLLLFTDEQAQLMRDDLSAGNHSGAR
jgi:hypothetical protein